MGLDVHVMPISAFISGDYDPRGSGVESGPRGVKKVGPRLKWLGWLRPSRRGEGLLYVEWLREQFGPCPRWNEEGDAILSLALPVESLHALRAAAARVDSSGRLFAHVTDHSDFQGFYLPFAFAEPRWIPDPRWADHPWFKDRPEMQKTSVGSTVELAQELADLEREAGGAARAAWEILDRLARTSLESNTPICFDG